MQETIHKVLSGDFNKRKALMLAITALITLIVWNLPITSFGIDGLTVVQQRVIAIFVMAVLLWLTEAIPSWATSIVIIFVLLFCVSDSAFNFLQGTEGEYGELLDYQGVMSCFADPTIILFLGGFILAIAATKSGLDRSEEHTSELQSRQYLVCRLLLEKKKKLQYCSTHLLPLFILFYPFTTPFFI